MAGPGSPHVGGLGTFARIITVARKFLIGGLCVSAGGLWFCAGGLDTLKIDKTSTEQFPRLLTQSLHDQCRRQDIKQEAIQYQPASNICQPDTSARKIWTFLVLHALISFIALILVESDQH